MSFAGFHARVSYIFSNPILNSDYICSANAITTLMTFGTSVPIKCTR